MTPRAPGIAAVAWLACAGMAVAAEEGLLVEVPVDAPRSPVPELVNPRLPPVTERSAHAMDAALATVVREFCIAGIAGGESDVRAAARIGAVAVPDPWQGERFLWTTPRTTWSLPSTPRLFFWLGASEIDGFHSCEVLAFEGDRMQLARTALDGLERHAAASGFGAPTRAVGPLTDLAQRGYIDLVWDSHGFTASIAEDRGDPALVGLHVSIHAPTALVARDAVAPYATCTSGMADSPASSTIVPASGRDSTWLRARINRGLRYSTMRDGPGSLRPLWQDITFARDVKVLPGASTLLWMNVSTDGVYEVVIDDRRWTVPSVDGPRQSLVVDDLPAGDMTITLTLRRDDGQVATTRGTFRVLDEATAGCVRRRVADIEQASGGDQLLVATYLDEEGLVFEAVERLERSDARRHEAYLGLLYGLYSRSGLFWEWWTVWQCSIEEDWPCTLPPDGTVRPPPTPGRHAR